MKIVVQGHTIETTEIFNIVDLSDGRTAGFEIQIIDKPSIVIKERLIYELTPREIGDKHRPYDNLRKSIEKQWNEDKTDLKVFKL